MSLDRVALKEPPTSPLSNSPKDLWGRLKPLLKVREHIPKVQWLRYWQDIFWKQWLSFAINVDP